MEPLDYVALSPQETAKLLSAGNGDAALVYLYIKATGDRRLLHAGERLSMQNSALSWAESLLKQLGLLDVPQNTLRYDKGNAPTYSAEAVAAAGAQDASFSLLQGEISRRLGRVLTSEELKTLLAIRDYLKLPPAVVSMALTYCLQRNEYYNQSHGTNRTVSMRTLEKECYAWANRGIITLEGASEYISRNLQLLSPEGQVKKVLHLDRPLVDSERQYIRAWLEMGFDPAAISLAYEKTVLATGKLAWRYLNKILLNWHEKNLHTPEQIQSGDAPSFGAGRSGEGYTAGGYTFGESDLDAIANLQKFRDSLKED